MNCCTSSMAKYGDQPGPLLPSVRGHRQVSMTSTSKQDNAMKDTLVGAVSTSGNCKVHSIRGGGWDNAIVAFYERLPRFVL